MGILSPFIRGGRAVIGAVRAHPKVAAGTAVTGGAGALAFGLFGGGDDDAPRTITSGPAAPPKNAFTYSGTGGGAATGGAPRDYTALARSLYGDAPDTSGISGAYGNYAANLRGAAGAQRAATQRQLDALRGQYLLTEDPNQRAIKESALQTLRNQADSARQSVDVSYGRGIDSARAGADTARTMNRAMGAENAALYSDAAAQATQRNAALSAIYGSAVQGMGGSQPVEGAGVDYAQALASAGVREAASGNRLGEVYAATQNAMASSLGEQQSAQQAQLQRDAAGMTYGIESQYSQREAERIGAERMAYANAQQGLLASDASAQAGLATQLAQGGLEGGLAVANANDGYQAGLRELATQLGVTDYTNGDYATGGSGSRALSSTLVGQLANASQGDDVTMNLPQFNATTGRTEMVPTTVGRGEAFNSYQALLESGLDTATSPEEYRAYIGQGIGGLDAGYRALLQREGVDLNPYTLAQNTWVR